jgi:Flp pilus assembly protein TadG
VIGLAAMNRTIKISRYMRRAAGDFAADRRALAAVEFAFILPLMLVLFFGTIEFSTGIAVDRKVSLTANTLSNLLSETPGVSPGDSATITDTDLQNIFTASIAVMMPYRPTPTNAQISQVYVDSSGVARVQWSRAATIASGATQATLTSSTHSPGDVITIPSPLVVNRTYLILSEVSYRYVPTIGYVMASSGVNLNDVSYSRPRQSSCIVYNNVPVLVGNTTCPLP